MRLPRYSPLSPYGLLAITTQVALRLRGRELVEPAEARARTPTLTLTPTLTQP